MACCRCITQCRKQVTFTLFLFLTIFYMMRVDLNVTLLSMVNDTTSRKFNTADSVCVVQSNSSEDDSPQTGTYPWDRVTQGIILGSFFYGYIFTQIPGGLLGFRFGPRLVGALCILVCSTLDLCIPFLAARGYEFLIAGRVAQGLAQGATYPLIACLIGRWIPPNERSRTASFVNAGSQLGTVIGQSIAGVLSQPRFRELDDAWISYWPYAHHLIGSIGLLLLIPWLLLVYDHPGVHPRIKVQEVDHIRRSLVKKSEDQHVNTLDDADEIKTTPPTMLYRTIPWFKLVRSRPVWAVLIAHVTYNWCWYTLITCIPTYMSRVLGFSLDQNGLLSSLPYLVQCLLAQVFALVSDLLLKHNRLTTTWVRKLNNLIALGGIGTGLLIVSLLGCDRTGVLITFIISIGLMGAGSSGYFANAVDIAPQYAGVIISITNMVATLPGIFGPLLVGHVTKESSSLDNWRIVFGVSTGLAYTGALLNLLMTSGILQPWARTLSTATISTPVS